MNNELHPPKSRLCQDEHKNCKLGLSGNLYNTSSWVLIGLHQGYMTFATVTILSYYCHSNSNNLKKLHELEDIAQPIDNDT